MVDEFTKESLCIDVAGSIRSKRLIQVLEQLIEERGCPIVLISALGSNVKPQPYRARTSAAPMVGCPPAPRPSKADNVAPRLKVHGNETRAKRAERSRKSAELHQLVDLGNAIGMFNGKVALRGRRPASKTPAKETA
jgi:hypothetical protein